MSRVSQKKNPKFKPEYFFLTNRLNIPALLFQSDVLSFFSRKRWSYTVILLISIGLMWACATDKKKPSPVATQIGHVRTAIARLTESYEKKDKEGFFAGLDPSSESFRSLRKRVLQDFEHFSRVEISITIDRGEINEASIKTAVHWRGVWKESPDLPDFEKRGNAIFQWAASDDLKLIGIRGESPFGIYRNTN